MSKVLIIEDDKILQKMYQNKFEAFNFQIIVASDGEEGLKKAKEEMPDFILLDLMMPKLSGVQVLRTLKSTEETKKIPVAILSVIPQNDQLLEGHSDIFEQIVAYFRKDEVTPSIIVDKVKEYLAQTNN